MKPARVNWCGASVGGRLFVALRSKEVKSRLEAEVEQPPGQDVPSIRRKRWQGIVAHGHFRFGQKGIRAGPQLVGSFRATEGGTRIAFVVEPSWRGLVGVLLMFLGWAALMTANYLDLLYGIPGAGTGWGHVANGILVSLIGLAIFGGVVVSMRSASRNMILGIIRVFEDVFIEK
jgi:hypothetical protein